MDVARRISCSFLVCSPCFLLNCIRFAFVSWTDLNIDATDLNLPWCLLICFCFLLNCMCTATSMCRSFGDAAHSSSHGVMWGGLAPNSTPFFGCCSWDTIATRFCVRIAFFGFVCKTALPNFWIITPCAIIKQQYSNLQPAYGLKWKGASGSGHSP